MFRCPNLALTARSGANNEINVYNGLGSVHYLADVGAVILAD